MLFFLYHTVRTLYIVLYYYYLFFSFPVVFCPCAFPWQETNAALGRLSGIQCGAGHLKFGRPKAHAAVRLVLWLLAAGVSAAAAFATASHAVDVGIAADAVPVAVAADAVAADAVAVVVAADAVNVGIAADAVEYWC